MTAFFADDLGVFAVVDVACLILRTDRDASFTMWNVLSTDGTEKNYDAKLLEVHL